MIEPKQSERKLHKQYEWFIFAEGDAWNSIIACVTYSKGSTMRKTVAPEGEFEYATRVGMAKMEIPA